MDAVFIGVGRYHSLAIKTIPRVTCVTVGSNIEAKPTDAATGMSPATLTFDNVVQPGLTFLSTSALGPLAPAGFQLGTPPVYFYLTTTAEYTGSILVCIDYSGTSFNEPPTGLFHYENTQWINVMTSHDTVNKIICGSVTSLSPFAIFMPYTNRPPQAICKDIELTVDSNCKSRIISAQELDGGSNDPDGDTLQFTASDLGPFSPGMHLVTLKVADGKGLSSSCTASVTVTDKTAPTIDVTKHECVPYGEGNGNMANKITVTAQDNCSINVIAQITKVEVFNNGGNLVKGNGVYEISKNILYVNPNGTGWSLKITVFAEDEYGNSQIVTITKSLIKC